MAKKGSMSRTKNHTIFNVHSRLILGDLLLRIRMSSNAFGKAQFVLRLTWSRGITSVSILCRLSFTRWSMLLLWLTVGVGYPGTQRLVGGTGPGIVAHSLRFRLISALNLSRGKDRKIARKLQRSIAGSDSEL